MNKIANPTQSTTPQLLTIPQAAAWLQISTRTVRRLIDAKTLPVLRIGRSVRILPEDLAALLKPK
jgi:excisionase family DNA binding protein